MEKRRIEYTDVADYFLALSNFTGNLISNLKLQKLMYYVQAWHLALYDERFFDGDFEAWVHGPVLPILYRDYKLFGWKPIERDDLSDESIIKLEGTFGVQTTSFIKEVVDEYFGLTAYELERLTHQEYPWRRAREGLNADESCHRVIRDEWLKEFYSKFVIEEA